MKIKHRFALHYKDLSTDIINFLMIIKLNISMVQNMILFL